MSYPKWTLRSTCYVDPKDSPFLNLSKKQAASKDTNNTTTSMKHKVIIIVNGNSPEELNKALEEGYLVKSITVIPETEKNYARIHYLLELPADRVDPTTK